MVENLEGYLSFKVPPGGMRALSPTLASQPRAPGARKGTYITSDCGNQWGFCLPLGDRRLLETQVSSSMANTQLPHRHSRWAPAEGQQAQRGARVIQRETELCGFRSRAKGQPPNVPMSVPPTTWHMGTIFLGLSTLPSGSSLTLVPP